MNIADFDSYYTELHHGQKPFNWQSELAHQVCETGQWPAVLDLPTACGKTAVMDIALFRLALEADCPPQNRQASRRIYFVVDRRLVVDEAFERASRIALRLTEAKEGTLLATISNRLSSLGGSSPLEVLRLRGGLPRERAFLRNPLQPAVIVSTVDQVGSRLLFRGYGVSDTMRPIHAALTATDSLIVLDEAHLSQPFGETIDWIRHYHRKPEWAEFFSARPCTFVQMTATPQKAGTKQVYFLPEADRFPGSSLYPRLSRPKPVRLVEVKGDEHDRQDKSRNVLANKLAEEARSLKNEAIKTHETPVVAIVVNRVLTARAVYELLMAEADADAVLLTGRVRSLERDELLEQYLPRMKAGRNVAANQRPLFVVATQTVEVGADLDFDALVTEAAALDALRQRFGRLNRLGSNATAPGIIVCLLLPEKKTDGSIKTDRKGAVAFTPPVTDPIYGEALAKTWRWLKQMPTVDFAALTLIESLKGAALDDLHSPTASAPVLLPSHLDLLAQTNPQPALSPEIAGYLHGPDSQPEDVQVIWRADLPTDLNRDGEAEALAIAEIIPPSQREAMPLPIWSVRSWLEGKANDLSDTEGGRAYDLTNRPYQGRQVLRLSVSGEGKIIAPDSIIPGDTLLIPAAYGGADVFGWHPVSTQAVRDIAEEAAFDQRRQIIFRAHPDLLVLWCEEEALATTLPKLQTALAEMIRGFREDEDLATIGEEFLKACLDMEGLRSYTRNALATLLAGSQAVPYPLPNSPKGFIFTVKANILTTFSDEGDASLLTRSGITLCNHTQGVAELAGRFAMGLPEKLADDVLLAAALHDIGKCDPRFQTWLFGGDRIAAKRAQEPMAKSGMNSLDRNTLRRTARTAGWPWGARHECYSVVLAKDMPQLATAHDRDLVLYLIGSHHGHGRAFMPVVNDNGATIRVTWNGQDIMHHGVHGLERLDSDWTEMYWSLTRKYGYWGLAYLETLVRLADHLQSEQEMSL